MEPRVIKKEAFSVVGAISAGQPGELNYSEIWEKQYMPMDERLKPYSTDGGYYGVTLGEQGKLVYLAAMAVEGLPVLPPGAERREIPAAQYAVFDCGMEAIGATWRAAYETWLPASCYELDTGAVDFEFYPPHEEGSEQRAEIYIPIRLKPEAA